MRFEDAVKENGAIDKAERERLHNHEHDARTFWKNVWLRYPDDDADTKEKGYMQISGGFYVPGNDKKINIAGAATFQLLNVYDAISSDEHGDKMLDDATTTDPYMDESIVTKAIMENDTFGILDTPYRERFITLAKVACMYPTDKVGNFKFRTMSRIVRNLSSNWNKDKEDSSSWKHFVIAAAQVCHGIGLYAGNKDCNLQPMMQNAVRSLMRKVYAAMHQPDKFCEEALTDDLTYETYSAIPYMRKMTGKYLLSDGRTPVYVDSGWLHGVCSNIVDMQHENEDINEEERGRLIDELVFDKRKEMTPLILLNAFANVDASELTSPHAIVEANIHFLRRAQSELLKKEIPAIIYPVPGTETSLARKITIRCTEPTADCELIQEQVRNILKEMTETPTAEERLMAALFK